MFSWALILSNRLKFFSSSGLGKLFHAIIFQNYSYKGISCLFPFGKRSFPKYLVFEAIFSNQKQWYLPKAVTKKGWQDLFSFLFMIAGCLIMWAFNWANLHKFSPPFFEFMSFHVHCLWAINSNFFSLLGWGKTFNDIILQYQQHIFSLNSFVS